MAESKAITRRPRSADTSIAAGQTSVESPAENQAEELHFTVASALLRELGERLVGQAHIALAELIKNSYDADADLVELTIDNDEIVVEDNGHGMSFSAFRDYWMRIGSPHKEVTRVSPGGRALTGSKGVGRLAAQFLAHEVHLETSAGAGRQRLIAEVDWDEAVDAGDLTQARALLERSRRKASFAGGSPHGTRLVLSRLKEDWDAGIIESLGRELWPLRPPFRGDSSDSAFDIRLTSSLQDAEETFERQMEAILELWDGRITARLLPVDDGPVATPRGPRTVQITVELGDRIETYSHKLRQCRLAALDYEIRVFDLRHRQPAGIKVGVARNYLNRFGGVHVYDAGFHLPYYGPDNDWLRIEIAHSHRITRSKLLPDSMQQPGALTFLPTNSRLWGVVRVDTGRELAVARQRGIEPRHALTIQVTRDRLVDNRAYRDLLAAVRVGLDFYAVLEAQKHAREIERRKPAEPLPVKAQRVEEVLERHRNEIPRPVYQALKSEIREVSEGVQSEVELSERRVGLLGALATAGISAVAFEHEFNRQLGALERSARKLRSAIRNSDFSGLDDLSSDLSRQLKQARQTRHLFGSLLNEEDRTRRVSPRARVVLADVFETLGPFGSGVRLDLDDLGDVRLPPGSQAEWSALWQNLVVNAINAMLDTRQPTLRASHRLRGRVHAITLEDNGYGIELDDAEGLFEPFRRESQISPERRDLGFGGTGLGLTIVRMLAESLNCTVRFAKPSAEFSTAVRVAWSER